jgi:hypothetical protein
LSSYLKVDGSTPADEVLAGHIVDLGAGDESKHSALAVLATLKELTESP